MSVIDRLGKKLSSSSAVMRLISNDRVMQVATGLMDARGRLEAAKERASEAWSILLNGHALPTIDPALEGGDDVVGAAKKSPAPAEKPAEPKANGATNGAAAHAKTNGAATNGAAAHAPTNGEAGSGEATSTEAPKPAGPGSAAEEKLAQQMASRTSLSRIGGRDVFEKCYKFMTADNARAMGVYPFFRPLDFNNGPEAQLEGRKVIMLGSNNYLGLTTHPKVREAARNAIDKYGTSMTGSRLVNGSMRLHNELEEKLAAYHGKEAGLVFTTGYQVNIATISALLSNKKSVAVIDKDDHASIYDGVRLGQAAGARMVRYRHNDPEALDQALAELDTSEGALVITDGVFSAQGEIANLPGIASVVKKHKARLFVDDAHALGVIGPGGRGTAAHFGVADQVDLIGGTFSKSLASIGGWLVGERKVLDYIQHFASSFLFAASAAPPCVAAAMAALEVMQEEPERQEKLRENFTYMRNELRRLGFELGKTETAVIPIYIRDDLRTVMMWKTLLDEHSIYVNPFITPGVPPKQQVLRTSYMATHERHHLDRALEAFEKVGKKFGVIS
ncbi:aminotransferase class I/II-fold pyridoxal phosphate-dependent enzyme [Polyangium sp. y55x31]|uniref:aminotransferase class I/II-fold pyridoxal phosphate-dependent enzyme n=1 Tax=Polyangium sp. y55x31 TaxID=3042688 RepID=UPI002482A1A8|nr:aminotransferase class I/II-fold pyridoxal phosphate-dependent enzyme [Polyangium sp. y55x31]MDI1481156.1 aminotransferase class I/II-fold pyridoxal phosphate-dependent enzyme [Polyangium sp. y55x31]